MQFVDVKRPGGPEVLFLNEGPKPEPRLNEVLIQVKAAGVNRPDLMQRAGRYPPPAGASPVLGLEVAGIVTELGADVKRWRVGDVVCALTSGGGYAEYCVVPEGQCLPLPEGLDFIAAASLPEVYFTVWGNLFMRAHLKKGESVLIHRGSSGIGSCAIQLAKTFGAYVATTVGSAEKASFCRDLKADQIIQYREEDFFAALEEKRVDVILDIVGAEYFEKNLALLKEEGRLVQVSTMSGSKAAIDLGRLLFKRLTVLGSTLRAQSSEAKSRIAQELLTHVWPLFASKRVNSVVTASFPLEEVSEAHRLLESGQSCGKIVLTIS